MLFVKLLVYIVVYETKIPAKQLFFSKYSSNSNITSIAKSCLSQGLGWNPAVFQTAGIFGWPPQTKNQKNLSRQMSLVPSDSRQVSVYLYPVLSLKDRLVSFTKKFIFEKSIDLSQLFKLLASTLAENIPNAERNYLTEKISN